jgi:MarR family transcriptional regulator for hemolysin
MENPDLSLMEMGKLMHEAFRIFKKQADELKPEEIRISTDQFGLLLSISQKEEDVIQKDMARMMRKDKSSILRMIDSLEEKGLVRRVAAIEDRRKNYLMITKAGCRVKDQYLGVVSDIMKNLQQGLSQSEIDAFNKTLSHLRSNAEKLLVV